MEKLWWEGSDEEQNGKLVDPVITYIQGVNQIARNRCEAGAR